MNNTSTAITIQHIETIVCDYLGIRPERVHSPTRETEVVEARQMICYFTKKHIPHNSLKHIGRYFGGQDHSTVRHSVNKIDGYVQSYPEYRSKVMEINSHILPANQ